jgi:HK97 family phage portal protein
VNPLARAAAIVNRPRELKRYTTAELLSPWQDNRPHFKEWDTETAIKDGFKASVWVYACVYRIMKDAASVPWIAEVRKGDAWEPDETHPLTELMEYPNDYMSRQDMIERLTAHLYLGGNGLWSKIIITSRRGVTRGRKIVAELWPIDPSGITPVPSRSQFIAKYRYEKDGVVIKDWDPAEIIHFSFTDPGNPYWGMSPLQAAARTVDTDIEAVKWNKVALQNRAVPDGIFSFPQALTKDQWSEARERVREQFQESSERRAPWVMGSSAQYTAMSLTPVEMDWLESRKDMRVEICAVYGVHPPIVGIYDDATLANIATARRMHWEDTIIPYLDDLDAGLNRSLVPHFGPRDQLRLSYDTTAVQALQRNLKELIDTGEKMHRMGIPVNDIIQRLELQLDPVEGGDVGYIPNSLVPIQLAGEIPPAADDGAAVEPEPEPGEE